MANPEGPRESKEEKTEKEQTSEINHFEFAKTGA